MLHRLCRLLQLREKSTGSFSLLSVIAYFISACRLTRAWWFFTLTSSMPYKGFSLDQQSEILHYEWCALVKAITATIWTFPAPTAGYTQTWTFSWLIWSEAASAGRREPATSPCSPGHTDLPLLGVSPCLILPGTSSAQQTRNPDKEWWVFSEFSSLRISFTMVKWMAQEEECTLAVGSGIMPEGL